MCSFLALFVPRGCTGSKSCNLTQLISDKEDIFARIVLGINTVTCLWIFYALYSTWRREVWVIEWFDQDKDKGDDFLAMPLDNENRTALDFYPEIKEGLIKYNAHVCRSALSTLAITAFNFALSLILVSIRYSDITTVTTILINAFLVINQLYSSYSICKNTKLAESCQQVEPRSYNIIDVDHQIPTKEHEIAELYQKAISVTPDPTSTSSSGAPTDAK